MVFSIDFKEGIFYICVSDWVNEERDGKEEEGERKWRERKVGWIFN